MTVISLDGHATADCDLFVGLIDLGKPGACRAAAGIGLNLDGPVDLSLLADLAPAVLAGVAVVRIGFSNAGDGRGFSLGRRLRDLGYRGRLRASGPLIPDQRSALTLSGFDEVELPADHLARLGGAGSWARAPALTPFRRRVLQRPPAHQSSAA